MLKNVQQYAEYATEAAQQNADIIVFPEHGILSTLADNDNHSFVFTRDGLLPYFQTVPNPKEVSWNPCTNPTDYNNTQILHEISCSAKNNSIAILVNILSREDCVQETDPNCPNDGRYQYNTNIVFDKNGTLITRYHKKHQLFLERILNSPRQAEYAIFTIDGIDFATFIDFDIMYEDPTIKLVQQHGIKNFIFTTTWINELPFFLAPQLYVGWTRSLGVNLIASNYHKPQYSRLGTGIYSSQLGALNETFDISRKRQLVIADVPIHPDPVPQGSECLSAIQAVESTSMPKEQKIFKPFVMTNQPITSRITTQFIHKIYYQSLTNFTAIYLKESEGNVSLCHKNACCNLVYNMSRNYDSGIQALVAFDGEHEIKTKKLRIQTCAVMRCENENNIESCGRLPEKFVPALFTKLSLTAQLEADVVLPSVLLETEDWSYSYRKCAEGKSQSKIELITQEKAIIVAGLYGRLYTQDPEV